jgi:hypothetical protein
MHEHSVRWIDHVAEWVCFHQAVTQLAQTHQNSGAQSMFSEPAAPP